MAGSAFIPLRTPYSRMVLEDQIQRVTAIQEDRLRRLAAIRTRRSAEAYRDLVSEKIAHCFSLSEKRTPLHARTVSTVEHERFFIENIIFESRPDCIVTANVYVPKSLRGPAPAVIGNCQHAQVGKADRECQEYAQELAHSGFVVMVFDPAGQGERDQYSMLPRTDRLRKICSQAHDMIGKQLHPTGEFLGSWMAWDGMRGMDYLMGRPEVDSSRIAVTGNSGGGNMTTWLWGLDRRFHAAAPSCFVTRLLSNLRNELVSDAEQLPPRVLAEGLDIADFFIARVPEPAILISQKRDFFDQRGTREIHAEVSRIYRLFNAGDKFAHFCGTHGHGYFQDGRDAMRKFFCQQFGRPFLRKAPVILHNPQELYVTPKGLIPNVRVNSIPALNACIGKQLRLKRAPLRKLPLKRQVEKMLGIHHSSLPVNYRNLRGYWMKHGHFVGRYAVNTERKIEAILFKVMLQPVHVLEIEKSVRLYVPHWSCEAELRSASVCKKLVSQDPLFAVDPRGMGESLCLTTDMTRTRWLGHHIMDGFAHNQEMMLGSSLLGGRIFDLLRVCDLLMQEGAKSIRLVGCGQGALIAAFAAMFHPSIKFTDLHYAPTSMEEWLKAKKPAWPCSNFIQGALRSFDFSDIYAYSSRKLKLHSTWDAQTCPQPGMRFP